MTTELEIQGELIRMRSLLRSGRAEALCRQAGFSNEDVARLLDCTAPSVWMYFNAGRLPRRALGLRLARLLEQLEVIRDALD